MSTHMLDFTDLEVGCEYAVLLNTPISQWQPGTVRPLRAEWDGTNMYVHDPDDPLDTPILRTHAVGLTVLGRWDHKPHPAAGAMYSKMSWQGVAAHAYGQVLRQRAIVDRLARVGIERDPEPYVVHDDSAPAVRRSLTLTFEELEFLLDRAGA